MAEKIFLEKLKIGPQVQNNNVEIYGDISKGLLLKGSWEDIFN